MYKTINPTSPGRRALIQFNTPEVYNGKPIKSLTKALNERAGRNNTGKITVRHRGGGCKRTFRIIAYKRPLNIKARVIRIEHDPNRSAYIALIKSELGELRYIISVDGLKAGDLIEGYCKCNNENKLGSITKLKYIPIGAKICNVELYTNAGPVLARSAGCYCQVLARLRLGILIKLCSGQKKILNKNCIATIGIISNKNHFSNSIGKAGRARWLGKRPSVRGVAMNPIDHPMGGGEGKTSGGRHPVSPWGKPSKGKKTCRKNIKKNDSYKL